MDGLFLSTLANLSTCSTRGLTTFQAMIDVTTTWTIRKSIAHKVSRLSTLVSHVFQMLMCSLLSSQFRFFTLHRRKSFTIPRHDFHAFKLHTIGLKPRRSLALEMCAASCAIGSVNAWCWGRTWKVPQDHVSTTSYLSLCPQ